MFKKLLMGLLGLVVLGIAFFFFYVVKTPHYSLYQIHKALQTHDTALFQRHVDLDSVYGNGLDDLISSGMKREKTIGMDPFVAGIMKLVKPTVLQAMKDATLESIRKEKAGSGQKEKGLAVQGDNGSSVNKANGQSGKNDQSVKKKNKWENQIPLLKKLKERLDVSNLKIEDASVTRKGDKVAELDVLLHDIKLDKNFNANMRMEQMNNGEWQIKEITNFVGLLAEVEATARKSVKDTVDESRKE